MAYTQINPATGKKFRLIGAPVVKKDAKALVTGKPVYTDDLALKDCLIVKVLRSPYAHALIEEIDCKVASEFRDRMYPYMEGCSSEAFYHGWPDLSGAKSV